MVITLKSLSLAATIIMLLPMLYFLMASLTFFLVRFDDPVVSRMLRGLLYAYFTLVMAGSSIAVLAFIVAGQLVVAGAILLLLASAFAARGWFLRQLDAQIRARDAGDATAVRAMRALHLRGIAYNAVQFVALVGSVPYVFGAG